MVERSQVAETAFMSMLGAAFQPLYGRSDPRAVESL